MNSKKYIFGYGSLVSKKSIQHTLGRDSGELVAVELKGWIRDWSIVLDNSTTIRRFEILPSHEIPHYVAALNIRRPRKDESATRPNGVIFEVTDADIKKMDGREAHYTREDVTNDVVGTLEQGARVYAYVGRQEFCAREEDGRDIILPKSYLDLVESSFDKEALLKFRETTLTSRYPIVSTVHSSGV